MAIVRTTSKETNTTGGTPPETGNGTSSTITPKSVDRTKSVVNPGGVAMRPAPRAGTRAPVQPSAPRSGTFVQETRAELQKVVWPTREDVRAGTIVTILLLIVFGAYIFGLDAFFSWLFHALGLYPNTPNAS